MKKSFTLKVRAIKAMGQKARDLGFTTINEALEAGYGAEIEKAYNEAK